MDLVSQKTWITRKTWCMHGVGKSQKSLIQQYVYIFQTVWMLRKRGKRRKYENSDSIYFLMHLLMIINVPGFLWSFTSRYYEVSLQVVTAATKCVIGVIWQCGADIGNHRAAWLDAFCPASSPHHSSGHSTAQVKKEKIWVLSSEKHLNPMTTTHLITSWIMICKVCFFLTVMHTIPQGQFFS